MERIAAEVEETEIVTRDGGLVPGLLVTCEKCGYSVKVFGTDERSARRGAVMLHDECPEDEDNFYVVD